MRKRAVHSKPELIGEILRKVLRKRNIPHTETDRRLVGLWERAVGPQIFTHTFPETVKRGGLYVRVSSSAWLHQLQFLKEDILVKINELSGQQELRRIYFSIGEIPARAGDAEPSPPGSHLPRPLRKRDRDIIKESVEAVQDQELRAILERVMVREISHRREREKRQDL